jgi:hypothetical protein
MIRLPELARTFMRGMLFGALVYFVVLGIRHFWRLVFH